MNDPEKIQWDSQRGQQDFFSLQILISQERARESENALKSERGRIRRR